MDPKLIGNLSELFEFYNKSVKDKLEIEARFGTYGENFSPSINYEQYSRLYSFFSSKKEFYTVAEKQQKIIQYENNIKEVIENKKSSYIEKTKVKTFEIQDYGVRIAFSKEIPAKNAKDLKKIRVTERLRLSFSYKESLIFDLDKTSDGKMSIELESLVDFETFMKNVNLVLKILQESEVILSNTEKIKALSHYKKTFSNGKDKFIGVQPETLTLEKLSKEEEYACTKKLDGKRFAMFNLEERCYLISNNMVDCKRLPYTCSYSRNFLIDGEFFLGGYHAFDLIRVDKDINVKMESLDITVNDNLGLRIDVIGDIFKQCKLDEGYKTKLNIKEYLYGNLYNSMYSLKESLNDKYEDGIIVVKINTGYMDSYPLKWKKIERLTIDFLIKKRENMFFFYVQDKTRLSLFAKNKVSEKDYAKYKSDDIVECYYDNGYWTPVMHRVDKKKPNFITVAQDNMKAIKNPFNFESIKGYSSRSQAVFFNLRRFHNFIKRVTLEKVAKNKEKILDLASGKGGDFGKYRDIGVKTVEAYEIDKKSIEISKTRIASIMEDKKNSIKIEVHHKDLNKDPLNTGDKFDVIVCNFAFHYFYEKIDNFIKTLTNNSKQDTHVVLTFFDGDKLIEHDNSKSKIVKVDDKKIEVYIKDSVLNKPTVEFIVDKLKVIEKMTEADFELVSDKNFSQFYENWVSKGNFLSDEEKNFSFMNVELIFKRK